MKRKVELLSPAGGYETMVGAFNAGADAVYLGGTKFGARAYADNFDTEQVLDAISYAHLQDKKIYLTVNTLVKEKEFGELYDFMLPYAEKRLDGVIVQDYGVMRFIREEFPEVELHASTQQTVTGVYGAKLLKELGCCRVVPARELSLAEMKAIRTEADIEVEAFIHGAMCYCYSGACLFSSMVGERSGNRGRCAQPCRLPYSLDGKNGECYPLSLKDMCTINIIPELIKAGIDSFKIEGRMKRPEYSAGVTSLYRKYIDMYYAHPDKELSITKDDLEMLKSLYLRTKISEGYYHKHNGKDMVTIASPAYNGTSEEVLKSVKEKYLSGEMKIKADIFCKLTVGEPLELAMICSKGEDSISETVYGNAVQTASKRPMDEESVRKQLSRLGNTPFEADTIEVIISDESGVGVFVPVSELNEIRRQLCEKMEKELLDGHEDVRVSRDAGNGADEDLDIGTDVDISADIDRDINTRTDKSKNDNIDAENAGFKSDFDIRSNPDYCVLVSNLTQLKSVILCAQKGIGISRVYIDSDLFFSLGKDVLQSLADIDAGVFVALPYVTRTEEAFDATKDLERIISEASEKGVTGILVRNLEQLGFLREKKYSGEVILDYGVYNWNSEAARLLEECNKDGFVVKELSIPYELTIHEAKELSRGISERSSIPLSLNVYGRTPMMISAGCLKKTLDNCSGKMFDFNYESFSIKDRMGNLLPVITKCRNCYNIIWNVYPTSLIKKLDNIVNMKAFDHFRIDFTTENAKEVETVLRAYIMGDDIEVKELEKTSTTTGHYKRGVE